MGNKKVYFTTLGCSKNEVDTNNMESILESKNYKIVFSPEAADIIVVNTCGFIESAKEESIEEIFEMARLKKSSEKKLIVSGCLAQRYPDELMNEIPEIDGILGTGKISSIDEFIENIENDERLSLTENINAEYAEGNYRKIVNPTEYVKIAEGCNNNCSYCIIPKLRGKNRSRKIENIVDEVEYLTENGCKEVILIAQNTTDYGIDICGKSMLPELLENLEKIENLKWIRVLYLYPDNFSGELIKSFKNNKKLLKYADIPFQHVNDGVLRRMNRRTDKNQIESLIKKLRNEIPDIIIRTTFIVGFPGETEEEFEELLEFVKENRLDRVGVFEYSKEEDTPAYNMKNQIAEEIKTLRKQKIMETQLEISFENMKNNIGKVYECIVDEISKKSLVVRSYMDSPEIDGVIYVDNKNRDFKNGEFIKVKIKDALEYDMIGEIYEPSK